MDDLRKFALDIAATAIRGAPFTEIVKAAEAFHAFLSGAPQIAYVDEHGTAYSDDNTPIGVFAKRCKGPVDHSLNPNTPPPLPSNHDLAQADQSPPLFMPVQRGMTREGIFTAVVERDPDNIPTRLVRREDLPPDAA